MSRANTIIFDLGGVLVDWDPRRLYRKIFNKESDIDWFLEHVCHMAWNEEQDAGRTLMEATVVKIQEFPEYAEHIKAYYSRWDEMLGGPIQGTVRILDTLAADKSLNLYALTNWSAETFPIAIERYDFLNRFKGIVVSGTEKTRKPYPDIYNILLDRYQVNPNETIFIDDNVHNVSTAKSLNIDGIHFTSPSDLKVALTERGLLK